MEPPTLIPWGWTDAAAGFMDTGKDGVSQETWPCRRWSWDSGEDQTPDLGGFSACPGPPALLCLGICPSWPSLTHSLALLALHGMGTHQDPLPASGPLLPLGMSPSPVRPWVGQTLCGHRPHCCSGGHCGTPAPSFHCKGLPQLCGHCPPYPRTHGGNFSYFLK